jgi:hypothetical protein
MSRLLISRVENGLPPVNPSFSLFEDGLMAAVRGMRTQPLHISTVGSSTSLAGSTATEAGGIVVDPAASAGDSSLVLASASSRAEDSLGSGGFRPNMRGLENPEVLAVFCKFEDEFSVDDDL